jgi:hypothetical protein
MANLKTQIETFAPMVMGLYCLFQGGVLAFNSEPLIQLLGIGLLLPVPACTFYTWRGFQAMPQRVRKADPVPEPRVSEEEHEAIA